MGEAGEGAGPSCPEWASVGVAGTPQAACAVRGGPDKHAEQPDYRQPPPASQQGKPLIQILTGVEGFVGKLMPQGLLRGAVSHCSSLFQPKEQFSMLR